MMGKVMALASDLGDALASLGRAFMARELVSFPGVHEMRRNLPQNSKHLKPHGILVDDLSAADLIELFTVLAADNAPHRHMLRIRAPTSRRTCLGSARPDAAATTIGHVVHSNNGSRVAGMNRVRAA